MKRTVLGLTAGALAFGALALGCQSNSSRSTSSDVAGFLSNYTRLEPAGDDLRYVDLKALANYRRFIVEPIQVFFYKEADLDSVDEQALARLSDYMAMAIREALGDSYELVSEPAPGVAHLRIALTDLDPSTGVLGVLSPGVLADFEVSGASMEAELTDSVTDEQIAAVIESQTVGGILLNDLSEWQDAEQVIDGWAATLRARLDEAHGE